MPHDGTSGRRDLAGGRKPVRPGILASTGDIGALNAEAPLEGGAHASHTGAANASENSIAISGIHIGDIHYGRATPSSSNPDRASDSPASAEIPSYLTDPTNWPRADAWDPLAAGVHRARPGDGGAIPDYVQRDRDDHLRERLRAAAEDGGLVLIVGDSTAGKTRSAYEALRDVLPGHRVLEPRAATDLAPAVELLRDAGVPVVVWLDDLERYLRTGGLEPSLLNDIRQLRIPILATMRTAWFEAAGEAGLPGNWPANADGGERLDHAAARVLELAEIIDLDRIWSPGEVAEALDSADDRVRDAAVHHGVHGVAEYLAAGPLLWAEWRRATRAGGHPRGAALVRAAVDLARTGLSAPYPRDLVIALHEHCLIAAGGELLRPEPLDAAILWATRVRQGVTSMLLPVSADNWSVFDYLVDQTQLGTTLGSVPAVVWHRALEHADRRDRFTIGVTASRIGLLDVVEAAWKPLADSDSDAAYNLYVLLSRAGREEEAQSYYRKAARAGHPHATGTLERLATMVRKVETEAYWQVLGGDYVAVDTQFVFRPARTGAVTGSELLGQLSGTGAVFSQLRPQRLVITGAPGSGKTVLAINLVLELLEQRSQEDPVPVRISLASWSELRDADSFVGADPAKALEAWLRRQLEELYLLPRAAASALVHARMIVPVLDGLDEVASSARNSRARHVLQALNTYRDGVTALPMVITCRSAEYQELSVLGARAEDAALVEMCPVNAQQILAFIAARVRDRERWRAVLDHLGAHSFGPLAQVLSSPLWLTSAVAAYEQRDVATGGYLLDPGDLLDITKFGTEEAVRDHLLGLLIVPRYSGFRFHAYHPNQVRVWLAVLAAYLNGNAAAARTVGGRKLSGTDLTLHELWPLAGTRLPRVVHFLLASAAWTALAAVGFAVTGIGLPPWQVLVAGAGVGIALLGAVSVRPWPKLKRSGRGRPRLTTVSRMASGALISAVIGIFVALPAGVLSDPMTAVAAGLGTALCLGLMSSAAQMRYLALLLCTGIQGKLPWRLGRFLYEAEQAGLLRRAGTAYQFRHRHLQDWLSGEWRTHHVKQGTDGIR
ncbi:NACHT domain-containing protein [Streptomyces sp. NBC_01483]|uniref:NACHT domain-containing protein n=1 Tax=Streptomyces sp. NBC_01483 TaxID=2903883 RepID=UPI002E35C4A8|nr:NACHT domain-containing protein [Streptomyces sp. NBC_01483]